MEKAIISFIGPSNSGKTTLITKVIKHFKEQNLKILAVKHDPKDKAIFDYKTKDSFKFFQSQADVLVLSPKRTTFFSHEASSLFDFVKNLDFDLCLVEGFRELDIPKLAVFCKELDKSYLELCDAITSYEEVKSKTWFHLDDIALICSYILKNAKKLA